ncbi:helix-turn-helix transcriptional regulator [Natrinema salaciae]|uniref:IclR helix-turn-helix domain-containing protein n=1 Tax=Natrinema salaciae TaxID=1186196 RepID=A0A1H9BYV3_9EURY|nr:hypothetical protein [Natrinema salaciae]SEP94140.1 hypothetical protein SAMN04489841_0904 [Natrinema salaciae]
MNRPVSVGFVVLVVLASVAGISGSVALAAPGPDAPSATGPDGADTHTAALAADSSAIASQETQNFDETTFEITVYENGSATWTFRHERLFANEDNESEAERNFREFATAFEANETGLYEGFINQSHELVAAGSREADREMAATTFRRSAWVDEGRLNQRGIVEMSFTWTNFAAIEGETIVVGDVFRDLYLASDQSIVLEPGGDLQFRTVAPDPDTQYDGSTLERTGSVQWSGEQQFADGQPHAELVTPTGAAAPAGSTGLLGALESANLVWYLVGGLLVAAVGVAAVVWYRRYGPGAETADGTTDQSSESPPRSEGDDDAAADSRDTDPTNDGDDAGPDPLSEEELMTDEDRVVKLIRENGGRMKQVNIVDATGWSKSKVSMLLSDMEDDGTISKLRVGRENIISLEGFEPEATKSPFEE